MNGKRFAVASGLGLILVLLAMQSFTFGPVRAFTETAVTPPPAAHGAEVPRSHLNASPVSRITDDESRPQLEGSSLASSSAVIANGGFENGQDGSWEEYSTHGWDIIRDTAGLPVAPRSGDWAAWLGGDHDDVSYISQTVTVPADSATLRYWYWIGSADVCGYDYAWVKINNINVQTIDLCSDNDTGGWAESHINLSVYAGQTVTLQFRVETDGSENSNYFIDDVTLGMSTSHSIHLPLILNNFWAGYFDDFSDPNSGWLTGESEYAVYGYLSGEYQVYLKQVDSGIGITPGTMQDLVLPSDYRVEVDARKVSAGTCSYGLRFGLRYTSDSYEGYQVIMNPTYGDFYVNKRTLDGSWYEIMGWTYSSAINQDGGTNHIAVERIGSAINLYMNGTQVANLTDSSFVGSGRDAGFVVYSYDDAPVDVRFDDFSASQP